MGVRNHLLEFKSCVMFGHVETSLQHFTLGSPKFDDHL